jgi:hypothetical protein
MGLDLWFREDVARILASTQETMHTSLQAVPALDPEMAATYEQGFADALRSVAIAFGVSANEASTPDWRQALVATRRADLDIPRNGGNETTWSVVK